MHPLRLHPPRRSAPRALGPRAVVVAAAAALMLAACGQAGDDGAASDAAAAPTPTTVAADATPTPSVAATTPAAAGPSATAGTAVVAVSDSSLGEILVDGEGMTLYVFDVDPDGDSACTGDCLDAWPPLLGTPSPADGVTGDLSTFTRSDGGGEQVMIGGRALYTWAQDEAPGDVTGQGVNDVWWVVAPDGTAITGTGGASEDADAASGDGVYG